jgi:cyclopropane-fatty-acyl-phospholipid synthase
MVFSHGSGMVFQMQLARQRDAAPITRDYLYADPMAVDQRHSAAA